MDVARRNLVDHAIQESNVVTDVGVEGQQSRAEIVIAHRPIEIARARTPPDTTLTLIGLTNDFGLFAGFRSAEVGGNDTTVAEQHDGLRGLRDGAFV